MPNGAGLSGDAPTADSDFNIKAVGHIDGFKWLPDDHATGFTTKVFIQATLIDNNIALACPAGLWGACL